MANPIITRIQVEGNDVVSFLNGTTPPYTYVRSMSQILPQSPTYISYRYDSITISQVGGEAFTFTVYTITQVGGNAFTALNFQDPATTVQAKTVEIYRLLVTSIFKGCCECGNTEPECAIQYTYGNSGFTGEFDYTYGTPGLIRFNDITGNNQNFSGFFPLIPDGSWVFLFSKTDPTVYAVLQLSNYSSGGGSAGFDAIELNANGTPFVEGTQFCVDFTSVGGSLVQGWQDTLNINPNLNQDNTVDGGGYDFVFDNNNSFTINGPGGSFEVDAFGPSMNAGTQQILVTAGYIDINTPLIGSASPGDVLTLTASGHIEYAPPPTGNTYTVTNGLHYQESPVDPNVFHLGGNLIEDTTIYNQGFDLTVERAVGGYALKVENTGTSIGTVNHAIRAVTTDGLAGDFYAGADFYAIDEIEPVVKITRTTTLPPDPEFNYDNIGSSIDMMNPMVVGSFATVVPYASRIASRWTNSLNQGGFAVNRPIGRTELWHYDGIAAESLTATFNADNPYSGGNRGMVQFNQYGQGTFHGLLTPVYGLAVDDQGNILEVDLSGGGTYDSNQGVYKDTTLTNDTFMLGAPIGLGNTIAFQVDREVDLDDKKFFINGAEPTYGTDGMVNIVGNGSGLGGFMLNISTPTGIGAYVSAPSGYGYEIYQGFSSYIETKSDTEEDALRIGRTTITTSPGYDKKTSLSFLLPNKTNGAGIPAFGAHVVSGYEPAGAAILHSTYLGLDAYDLSGTTRKRVATFYGAGYVNFEAYGIGTYFDPSPAYALGVDSSGNVVEFTPGASSPLTTKGDLYTYSTTNDRLPVGTNGQVLTADSTTATGLKWDTPTTGGGLKSGTATQVSPGVYETTISGVTSLAAGDTFIIKFDSVNEGASTLEINTLTPYDIFKNTNVKISSGDIKANQEITVVFDGTAFQAIGLVSSQLLAYVHNEEGAVITKGQVVYAYQASGDKMSVKLARADSDATSAKTVGLVYDSSIGIGGEGYIIIQGVIEGINTSAFSAGNTLYLSGTTFGGLTATKPYAPIHLVYVGIVEKANAGNGQIYVRCQNGYEMDELHDVASVGAVNNDILYRDTTVTPNLWKPASIPTILGYTPVPTTRSISTTSPLTGGGDLSADRTISIPAATSSVNGYLTSTDWTNFNTAYTNRITSLTTNNTSGDATLSSNTLNVPNYALNDLGRIAISTANAREDDYAPSGWPGTSDRVKVIAIDSTNTNYMMSLGGLASPVAGRVVTIVNNSTANNLIIIENLSTSSTAANRFRMTNNMAYFLLPTRSVTFIYDGTYWTQMSASNAMGLDFFDDCTGAGSTYLTGFIGGIGLAGIMATGAGTGVRAEGDNFGSYALATGSTAAGYTYLSNQTRKAGGNNAFATNSTYSYLMVGRISITSTATALQDFQVTFGMNGSGSLGNTTTPIGYTWYYNGQANAFWDNRSQNVAGTVSTVASPLAINALFNVLGVYKPGGSNIRDAVYFYSTDGIIYQVSSVFNGTTGNYGGSPTFGIASTVGTTSKEIRMDYYGSSFNLAR